ncbi:MAG: DUF6597 domain-containing transcriptional factor [Flavitalea sp.]
MALEQFVYYTIEPPAALAHYVRSYWVFEGSGNHASPYVYRSMADPCVEMVFHTSGRFSELDKSNNLIDGTDGTALIQAPSGKFSRYITTERFSIFGAYLYPFALIDLFGLSADELRNNQVLINDVAGSEGNELEESIMSATGNTTRADILSAFLLSRVKKVRNIDHQVHNCIRQLLLHPLPVRISALTNEFCISERQLQRKFRTLTGFAPKTYTRLTRFQHVLNKYGGDHKSLTHLALDAGYFDQAHFINDFKEFSGYEPGLYFAGKGEGIEYRDV